MLIILCGTVQMICVPVLQKQKFFHNVAQLNIKEFDYINISNSITGLHVLIFLFDIIYYLCKTAQLIYALVFVSVKTCFLMAQLHKYI